MTIDEFRRLAGGSSSGESPPRRRNKFHAKATRGYDSKKEYRRACQLKMMERAGEISSLREQVAFELIPAQYGPPDGYPSSVHCDPNAVRIPKSGKICLGTSCKYIADFVYIDKEGRTIVEDTKGVRTKEYIIKRKLMLKVYGIRIKEL